MKLIKNCRLIDMAGTYMEKRDMLIEDGKIKDIQPEISEEGISPENIYDAENNVAVPGFIDIHCQVGVTSQIYRFEGDDANEVSGPMLPHLRAIDAIDIHDEGFNMALLGGVTTVIASPGTKNVLGGTCTAFKTSGKSFKERTLIEEIAFFADLTSAPRNVYGKKDIAPKTRMASASILREALFNAKEYHRAKKAGSLSNFDMKMESLQRVFDGMLLKIHAEHSTDIITAARLLEEFNLNGIIVGASDILEALPHLNKENTKLAIGPVLVSIDGYESRNKNPETGARLQDKNIDFAVITAHPSYNIEYTNVQLGYMKKRGMKNPLEASTIIPAKMLGIDNRVGSLEIGKDADIVLWDKEPLDFYASVKEVFINGEIANIIH